MSNKKIATIKININQAKRKMGENELKLYLQAKRGCGSHKSKKDYNRKASKLELKNY